MTVLPQRSRRWSGRLWAPAAGCLGRPPSGHQQRWPIRLGATKVWPAPPALLIHSFFHSQTTLGGFGRSHSVGDAKLQRFHRFDHRCWSAAPAVNADGRVFSAFRTEALAFLPALMGAPQKWSTACSVAPDKSPRHAHAVSYAGADSGRQRPRSTNRCNEEHRRRPVHRVAAHVPAT
jgi:hypothetical protein